MEKRRPPHLRRSWLFVAGAERDALVAAPDSGADVAIQELEDFTPPARLGEARGLCGEVVALWRDRGVVAAVRVNPLEKGGLEDLDAAMAARAEVILLPKADTPEQIAELDRRIGTLEARFGIAAGSTEIVPNVELALGLVNAFAICRASPRVTAALVAAEDMAADLGAERSENLTELDHVRARFHVDCRAAGVLSIDMPYTWSSVDGARRHALGARRLGYRAKSVVDPAHVAVINEIFTPGPDEIAHCRRVVAAFEAARAKGEARVEIDGIEVEVPIWRNALDVIERARALDDQAGR
jgi:citrate lyase subunit beta / citryl-CoA lyase